MEIIVIKQVDCRPYNLRVQLTLCMACEHFGYITCDGHVVCNCPLDKYRDNEVWGID